jgi:hypothetical protein
MFMNRTSFVLAATLALASTPAFADAVTYTGTLGYQQIVLEVTEPNDGPLIGRYTYLLDGTDIPLHGLEQGKDDFVLAEEKRCTPEICIGPGDDLVAEAPLGGEMHLHYSADRSELTGTWHSSATASEELQVALNRTGSRSYERRPTFLYNSFLWNDYNGEPITPTTTPYDYVKMQVALDEGALVTTNGATYRDVVDPRTKFAFPRVVSLPGGGDVGPVNTMLDQQRWSTNFAGFECLAMDYLGGGWDAQRADNGYSSLGDIDQESISVDYLSATVMSIGQGGSIYCSGGSPHNHIDYYTYDVRRGGHLDLSRIFKGWDATTNKPTQPLIDWVIAAYPKMVDYDADYAVECEINENFAEHLDIAFGQGEFAGFVIGGIDQAACMGAMVTVPLADIRDLLTDEAADYFPSLKS